VDSRAIGLNFFVRLFVDSRYEGGPKLLIIKSFGVEILMLMI
jgi:hypothetical protein